MYSLMGTQDKPGLVDLQAEEELKVVVKQIAANLSEKRCDNENCASILVVDDNEFNRYLLIQLLTKYGYVCKPVNYIKGKFRQQMVKRL